MKPKIEKHPELYAETPDDALLLPSQVAAIFGIPTDILKKFVRERAGLLPVLANFRVRYRFGDVREFYQSEEFSLALREYEESQAAEADTWKALFMKTFSARQLPEWLTNEMRTGLRDAVRDMVKFRLAEELGNLWSEEFLKREVDGLPERVMERARMEAAKFLGRRFDEMLADPAIQKLIKDRFVEQVIAKAEEHPLNRELLYSAVDHERVNAALEAAQSNREKGWVYLIQGGHESDVKIGKTSKLSNRLSSHRSSNPRFRLVASLRGYTQLESRLHNIFSPYRMANREWFLLSLTIQEFLRQAFQAGLALRPEVTGEHGENETAAYGQCMRAG